MQEIIQIILLDHSRGGNFSGGAKVSIVTQNVSILTQFLTMTKSRGRIFSPLLPIRTLMNPALRTDQG